MIEHFTNLATIVALFYLLFCYFQAVESARLGVHLEESEYMYTSSESLKGRGGGGGEQHNIVYDRPFANARMTRMLSQQQSDADALCALKEGITNWPGTCTIAGWNCSGGATNVPCGSPNVMWTGITCSGSVVTQLSLIMHCSRQYLAISRFE